MLILTFALMTNKSSNGIQPVYRSTAHIVTRYLFLSKSYFRYPSSNPLKAATCAVIARSIGRRSALEAP